MFSFPELHSFKRMTEDHSSHLNISNNLRATAMLYCSAITTLTQIKNDILAGGCRRVALFLLSSPSSSPSSFFRFKSRKPSASHVAPHLTVRVLPGLGRPPPEELRLAADAL